MTPMHILIYIYIYIYILIRIPIHRHPPPDAATSQLAVKGVIGAIKEPLAALTQISTLLALPAVKRLEGDAAHGAVYQLLQVFSFGKLGDLLAYEQSHPDVLARHGIEREKAVRDMRLLSLSLLASEFEEIPYAEVSKTLQVPQEEVEAWVVEAITAKLIEARMDQQAEAVMVTRATHRHFTGEDWRKLQEKLHLWRHNVQGLLATLRAGAGAGPRSGGGVGGPSN
jgi:translation initiation factor 3 subunit M